MRLTSLSFRWKMVGPAAAASAAMLLATLAAAWLLSGSVAELRELEESHFPLLQLSKDLEVRVAAVQRQLQDAAATEDAGAVDAADVLVEDLRRALEIAPEQALPATRRAEIAAGVDGWYQSARAVTLRLVQRDASPELRDAVKAMGARYKLLRADLDAATVKAQQEVAEGFARSRKDQELVRTWGVVMVVAATLVAVGVALALAREAARRLEKLARAATRISEGDLTEVVSVEGQDEVGDLARSFERMSERLRVIVRTLKESSMELAEASSQLVEHTEAQTQNLTRQAAGVTETSTTTRELEQASSVAAAKAASVLEVARRAGQMSDTGRDAADRSLDGLRSIQTSVEGLVAQSAKLLEQARQVGDVVETVRDLAMQSHVLSLNASIEAARAGEAGKGFGVVAAEVRALAEQSGRAAAHIGRIVKEILGAIQSTLETTAAGTRDMEGSAAQIRASGESLREIGGIVGETSEAALQIAGAVQQQSQGVAQIAAAMRDLDKGMEDTVGRIDRLRDSASRLTETATRISLIADGFRV